MRKTVSKTTLHEILTCDVCGRAGRPCVCRGCRRDVCHECCTVYATDLFSADLSDGPDRLCAECDRRYVQGEYCERATAIRDAYDTQIEALEAEFRGECGRASSQIQTP